MSHFTELSRGREPGGRSGQVTCRHGPLEVGQPRVNKEQRITILKQQQEDTVNKRILKTKKKVQEAQQT